MTKPTDKQYGIRFTIPDRPLAEQLRMIKEMREVVLTFAKVAGEEGIADLTPFDDVITKLEAVNKKQELERGE